MAVGPLEPPDFPAFRSIWWLAIKVRGPFDGHVGLVWDI